MSYKTRKYEANYMMTPKSRNFSSYKARGFAKIYMMQGLNGVKQDDRRTKISQSAQIYDKII